ncbi:MAG: DNA double-strand break repair nuclease NurA [candidate division WOR-3 bacterium]
MSGNSLFRVEIDNKSLISGISSKMSEIDKVSVESFSTLVRKIKSLADSLSNELVADLPKENLDIHRKTYVFACDGTIYTHKYSSIYLALASACSYNPSDKSLKPIFLPDIFFSHPYHGDLVCSLRMKSLEYQVAYETLKLMIEDEKKPDLVLLDGTLTFPDDFRTSDSPDWVREEFEDRFLTQAKKFFELLEKEKILVAGISKDPTANKYLLGIRKYLTEEWRKRYSSMQYLKCPVEISNNILLKSLFADEKSWKQNFSVLNELALMRQILWNKSFKRTRIVEVSCATRFPIAIENIRGKVAGFYFKIFPENRPFYVEAIFWEREDYDRIFQILSNLSYYSPRPGYPAPLFFAHHIGKISSEYAENILKLVHSILVSKLQGDYKLLLEDKFRESL